MQRFDNSSISSGLSSSRAKLLLGEVGPNALPEDKGTSLLVRFVEQFKSPLIYVLLFALFFDMTIWVYEGAIGVPVESLAIAFMLLLNAGLGTYQEHKAEAALAKLDAMTISSVWTLRDGEYSRIATKELVPGDLIRIELATGYQPMVELLMAMGFWSMNLYLLASLFLLKRTYKTRCLAAHLFRVVNVA